jgi:uncharacterized membrane protein YdjX (TVP38/TMEM64 family)
MKKTGYSHVVLIAIGFAVTITGYLLFLRSPYFEVMSAWVGDNKALFIATLVGVKIIGIIWPPIPGGAMTLGAIPIIGWVPSYLADFAGSVIGSCIAFAIARRWGRGFVKKVLDEATVEKLEKIKVKKNRETEMVFLFRIFGGTIVEAVCYGAGLLRIRFRNFLIGTIASHIVVGIPTFSITNNLFESRQIALSLAFLVVTVPLVILSRKRYFDFE